MLSSDKGFTIVELMVTSFLGFIIIGMALSSTMTNRNMLSRDSARTRLNQNLRGSLDIIGTDIRIAGENLIASFPAIEFTNGTAGAPDVLTIRRNLLAEVLSVCEQIDINTSTLNISFGIPGTIPGCIYSNQLHNYTIWNNYRVAKGGTIDAYIFDTSTKQGEFFSYNNTLNTGTKYQVKRSLGAAWGRTYRVGSSSMYILEEWKYSLNNGILKITQNQNNSQVFNVAYNITDFQVVANMIDGTTKSSFTTADQWSQIQALKITVSGKDRFQGQDMTKTVSGSYFPRNILSH